MKQLRRISIDNYQLQLHNTFLFKKKHHVIIKILALIINRQSRLHVCSQATVHSFCLQKPIGLEYHSGGWRSSSLGLGGSWKHNFCGDLAQRRREERTSGIYDGTRPVTWVSRTNEF